MANSAVSECQLRIQPRLPLGRILCWLCSVKLAPAIRANWVDYEFARGRLHKLDAGRAFLIVFWGVLIFGHFVSQFGLSHGATSG
jgi:hypothetical protein